MICPHCGFENQDGRKYCRACAKSLSAPTAAASVVPTHDQMDELPSGDPTPVDSNPIDQLAEHAPGTDSLRADFHSEGPAASSSGVNKKVIAIAAVLVVAIAGGAFWFLQKGDHSKDPDSGQTQGPVSSVAYHPDAASVKNREHLMAALRLIVAQQEARLADDPDDLDVCAVNTFSDNELGQHARESHYIIDQQCQPRTADGRAIRNGFTVTATPKVEGNPADAPTYCVDQTKIIRRYADSSEVTNATSVQHLTCPVDGQPVQ
jgi:zinc-ribbon domain